MDAHNIVPCWIASDKLEYGARTIRGKITRHLSEYLTPFPPVIKHPFSGASKAKEVRFMKSVLNIIISHKLFCFHKL